MKTKVCCITSREDANRAVQAGATAIGFASRTLGGPRAIEDERIREISRAVPSEISTFLLTSETDPDSIAEHQRETQTNTIQLVGEIDPSNVRALKQRLPHVALVKVIHVEGPESVDLAAAYVESADALLLDTKVRHREGDALGGTGLTHDWSVSRRIVEQSPVPVFLAGGLDPENVVAAIRAVEPFGVDVCSSLRRGGTLDPERVRDFVERARSLAN